MKIYTYLVVVLLVTLGIKFSKAQYVANVRNQQEIGFKYIDEKNLSGYYSMSGTVDNVVGGGLQYIRQLSKSRWSFETGLYYLSKSNKINQGIYPYGPAEGVFVQNFSYFNCPLNIRYDNKGLYVAAGVNVNYIKKNDYFYKDAPGYFSSLPYTKLMGFYNLNIGYQKAITKDINVFGEIRINTDLNPFGYHTYSWYFNNAGFGVGLNYKL